MSGEVFYPSWGAGFAITNATSATAAVMIPVECDQIVLTNTSDTAAVNVIVTPFQSAAETMAGIAPTLITGLPILPASQVRLGLDIGYKVIRAIASAADGSLIVTPGRGK